MNVFDAYTYIKSKLNIIPSVMQSLTLCLNLVAF